MMAKRIKALELHYPMIQFLIILIACVADSLNPQYRPHRVLYLAWSRGPIIMRGRCVSGHVVRESFFFPRPFVSDTSPKCFDPRGPGKTPYRDWAMLYLGLEWQFPLESRIIIQLTSWIWTRVRTQQTEKSGEAVTFWVATFRALKRCYILGH